METSLLCSLHPRLWHMAEPGSWPSIKKYGLNSTQMLLDRYEIDGQLRTQILRSRRKDSVRITKDKLPAAVIRDQKPMTDNALTKCLQDGLSPADWYEILNSRTFFWANENRLKGLLGARAYRNKPQTILEIDTRRLVDCYGLQIELCPINSGSALYVAVPRGLNTFKKIPDFDYQSWRKRRRADEVIVEVVVPYGVPDIARFVENVYVWDGSARTSISI